MNSKQRALTAINLQEPDRTPLDYWAVPGVTRKLAEKLSCGGEEELLRRLNIDFRYLFPPYTGPEPETSPDWHEDLWQVRRDSVYNEVIKPPLSGASSPGDLDGYRWPCPDWYDVSNFAGECSGIKDYCTVLCDERTNRTSVLHQGIYLRGMENMMIDLAVNPSLVHELFERITDFYLKLNRGIFEAAGGGIDVILIGDDFGTQEGLLISRKMLEEFVYPHLRKHFSLAREYGIKVMFHSCGAVREIIPDLIELGVDILNPLQTGSAGMDPAGLKKEFGGSLCFHGSLDTQQTLPFGSEEDVREEVRERIETLSPGGGFILAPAHNFQKNVPLENILSVYETAAEAGKY